MRRADRLFRLVQVLRKSRVVTAQRLASELEVSERTVYRDVRDLSLSGVPVRGEAGVGYALAHGFDLPPMTFTEEELEALVLGARVVQAHADPSLARAADSVLAKVEMVLPEALRPKVMHSLLMVPRFKPMPGTLVLGTVRQALRESKRLSFDYADEKGSTSHRTIRPLAVAFWGKTWTVGAWCELRKDFRSFRLDRMREPALGKAFTPEKGKTLDDFINAVVGASRPREGPHRRGPPNP